MKKELGLWDKLRIFYHWLKMHKDSGIITTCSKCNSTSVKLLYSELKKEEDHWKYQGNYKCRKCGASAVCLERWKEAHPSETT